jgi:Ca-activated chloride channel family protein
MDIQFGALSNLSLLWIVAAVVAVMALAVAAQRRAAARFATASLAERIRATGSRGRYLLKAALVTIGMGALVLALVDIRWGKTWREAPQKGIEVMFVLDVSRSMLAEDAAPNRLERAKQQIGDMLEAMAGDRVGLVAFAGDARRVVPLTSHYQDFKQTLNDVGPEIVNRGGSRLGEALRLAADGFLAESGNHKAIVVFTDGEDQESNPVETAERLAAEHGVRIFTVGLGDMEQGARIPERRPGRQRSYVQHHGQQVWSKMNGAVLERVAAASGGAYIPAGIKQVDMAEIYHNYLANFEQQDFGTARINSYLPRYQWFVGLGLLLLLLDTLLPAASGKSSATTRVGAKLRNLASRRGWRVGSASGVRKSAQSAGKIAACLALLLVASRSAYAQEPSVLVRSANEALHSGDIDRALSDYQRAAQSDPHRPELLYNQAVALYRKRDYAQSRRLLLQSASTADEQLGARVRYNLANCDYAEAIEVAEKDKPTAIAKLESAISHYRGALADNPADTDARANIQTARMLIEQLQQEDQQQEQDEQQQDQQSQEKQDQQDQNKGEEQQQDNQVQADQDQKQQDQQDQQQDSESKQDEKEQEQQKDGASQQDQRDPSDQDQQQQHDPSQQSPEESKQDQEQQDQDQGQDDDPQPGPQEPSPQEQPNPEQQESEGQPDGEQSLSGEPNSLPQPGDIDSTAEEDARPMTQEEARKMLQAVRDRELLRRLEQRREAQRRRVPVDRDW